MITWSGTPHFTDRFPLAVPVLPRRGPQARERGSGKLMTLQGQPGARVPSGPLTPGPAPPPRSLGGPKIPFSGSSADLENLALCHTGLLVSVAFLCALKS